MSTLNMKHLHAQRGAVLLISLTLLVVMTLISLSLMGNSTLEERMAANQMNNHLTFHAAESGSDIVSNDTATLSSAITSNSDITTSVSVGDPHISTSVTVKYEGDAIPTGWSLGENQGSFVAYNIRVLGTATNTNAHASSSAAQGISRIGPKY